MDYIGKHFNGITGQYKVVKHLASGGMGHVYEATNHRAQNVIIKFPATKMPDGRPMSPGYFSQVVEKLKVESQVLKNFAQTKPISIVKYIDESKNPDDFFLVIEKISGKPISKVVPSSGLPEKDVIKFSLDILHGLEFMHKHNTIYRDMKPDNIMLDDNKQCVLIDFGAAKQGITQVGSNQSENNATGLQSVGWTCPDQAAGKASAECDLYAFGRVLFFMATGIKPFRLTTTTGKMQKKLHQIKPAINMKLSNLVDEIIDPEHNVAHTASGLAARIRSLHATSSSKPTPLVASKQAGMQVNRQQGMGVNRAWQQQSKLESRIVLQGVEYKISNMPGGSLIGRIHNENACQRNNFGCNSHAQGRNIFIGWNCPKNCRCSYNPGHVIDKHHMRIWKDKNGQISVVNNDEYRRSAINRGGRWVPIKHYHKQILQNHDEVALLYNEKKGPYLSFTFYEK